MLISKVPILGHVSWSMWHSHACFHTKPVKRTVWYGLSCLTYVCQHSPVNTDNCKALCSPLTPIESGQSLNMLVNVRSDVLFLPSVAVPHQSVACKSASYYNIEHEQETAERVD